MRTSFEAHFRLAMMDELDSGTKITLTTSGIALDKSLYINFFLNNMRLDGHISEVLVFVPHC